MSPDLDDRMRDAAGRLHTAVALRLAETPEPQPLPVAPRRVRRGGLGTTATAVAVAAAFLIGCLAAVVVTGDDDDLTEAGQPVDLTAPHDWLLSTWVLEKDYEMSGAELLPPSTDPAVSGTIVAYGAGRTGPRLTVAHRRLGSSNRHAEEDFEPLTVGGHRARIASGSDGRVEIRWDEAGAETRVVGTGLTAEQVQDAAAHVEDGPSIGAAGLPAGFEELGRGPESYWGDGLATQELGGLTLSYGDVDGATSAMLQLTQRPGTQEELGLYPLWCEAPVEFQLFGASAYDCGGGGGVVFYDPGSQQIVEVLAVGCFDGKARSFAESLRPASQAEVEALVAPFEPPALPQPDPGEVCLQ